MASKENCPLKEDVKRVVGLGQEMASFMRRLRIKMRTCDSCLDRDGCVLQAEFNAAIDQVIQELNEEWGLI